MAYTESVVSFLDILGFGTLVSDATQHDKIDRVLTRLRNGVALEEDYNVAQEQKATVFSDCCVRSTPVIKSSGNPNSFGILAHEIMDLVHIQLELIAAESVLLRGAITIGPIHHQGDKVFGPALNRGYQLETEAAQYPRIILDPQVIKRALNTNDLGSSDHDRDQEIAYLQRFLKRDNDGIYFIDYLDFSHSESDDEFQFFTFLQKHKEVTSQGAAAFGNRPSLAVKYNWLIEYHNSYISGLSPEALGNFGFSQEDFLIDSTEFAFHQSLGPFVMPERGM